MATLSLVRPVAHKSDVVQQDVGVTYVWMCQEGGAPMYKVFAFLFHSYLHNHVPIPHILKTCPS